MRYAIYQAIGVLAVIWAIDAFAFHGRYRDAVWQDIREADFLDTVRLW